MRSVLLSLFSCLALTAAEASREVWPAESDLLYGSSLHIQFRRTGYAEESNLIVGKGNVHDHRYRMLVRVPLDTLLPKGLVDKATLSFRIKLFAGTVPQREYMLEMLEHNAFIVAPNDLQASRAREVLRFKMSRDQVNQTVSLDVTDAVNFALGEVWNGVVFRLRQDPEPNDDSMASGPAIFARTIMLAVE